MPRMTNTPSSLMTQLAEHVRAAFSGLYVLTHEPDEALAEIRRLCIDERWNLATWDVLSGLSVASGPSTAIGDPLAAVNALAGMAGPDETTLLVLRKFHRYVGGAEVIQALEQQLVLGQSLRTFVVILAPVVQLPIELEKRFVLLDHPLPTREQIQQIASQLVPIRDFPHGAELDRLLDAAAGLTRIEAENALALSLVRTDRLDPATLWELKAQALRK